MIIIYCFTIIILYLLSLNDNLVMKKLKILLALTISILLLYAVHFFTSIFILDSYQYYENQFVFIFNYTIEIVLFIALIFISIGLTKVIKAEFFNSTSSKFFKIGGSLFMLAAIGDIIYVLEAIITTSTPELWIQRIFSGFLLLILGLISIIVSDILKKGLFLKQENDLTI